MNKKVLSVMLLFVVLVGGAFVVGGSDQTRAQAADLDGDSYTPLELPVTSGDILAPQSVISHTYTLDADFDDGILINVNHDAPNNDQFQLDQNLTTFPFIWIALSGQGTVVKIDTETGVILGEYHSAPAGREVNPSRTTVDMSGNVWVGNRNESDSSLGSAVHIGLKENFQCVDRNGNGVIDTSTGLDDVKPWPNAGGADDNGGVSTAEDECIIHYIRTSGTNVRHVSVDANNDVWIGGYSNRRFNLVDGNTGAATQTTNSFSCGGYGGLVDGNGVVWSARLWSSGLLRYDPATDQSSCIGVYAYGMGIDNNGNIWAARWTQNTISKVAPDGTILGTFSTGGSRSRGVAVTPADNNIWVANSSSDNVTRLDDAGNLLNTISVGDLPTGVAVDAAGKVWVTNYSSSNAMRIDPATNQVDLTVDLGAGATPYNYSDMTGIVALGSTAPQGTWAVIYDSGAAGTPWGQVSWTSDEPAGSSVTVRVRSAETEAGLGGATYVAVSNAVLIDQVPNGRYLQVEVKLQPNDGGDSPIVYDVTVQTEPPPCKIVHDKTAFPPAVTVGGAVTVTISMRAEGECSSIGSPVDAMLVMDRSGSMDGQKLIDAKQAAIAFVGETTLPPDRIGVASFASSGSGTLNLGLGDDETAINAAINALVAGGMTDMGEGLEIAEAELLANGLAAKSPLIIILSDGHHNESTPGELQDIADRIKREGIRIIAVGLGNVDENQLKAIASSDDDYYYAPDSTQLASVYQLIAPTMWVAGRNMVLTDTVSSVATLIPDSFGGPISPTVNGDQIVWHVAAVPVGGITLTHQVAMTSTPGMWPTNASAIATFIDSSGNDESLVFPVPYVVVPVRCKEPDITGVRPQWACVDTETPLAVDGSGFMTVTEWLVITGTVDVDAYVGPQALTIPQRDWTNTLINAILPADSGLEAGKYDVSVVNTCNLADVIPGSSSHPTPTIGDFALEIFTGTLHNGFTLYHAPHILSIRPPEGYNDIPSDIVICGDGFAPGTEVFMRGPTGNIINLDNQATYGDTCLTATIPADLDPGDYTIIVQGPCGESSGIYRVLAPGINEDLWGLPEELRMLPSICARECDDIQLGFVVHRRGGKIPIQVDVRFYEGNPALGASLIGTGTIPLMSPGVPVPPDWSNTAVISGVSTSLVDWSPSRGVSSYTLYAMIDPMDVISEDIEINNVVSRTVQVLPCGPLVDRVAPVVSEFRIRRESDVTFGVEASLSLSATDYPQPPPNAGVSMMNIIEYLFNEAGDIWVPVQVSGWQPFSQQFDWALYPEGGMRFLQAWASDWDGNISRFPNFKYVNYIKSCDYVARNGVRIYRQHMEAGETLNVEVAPCDSASDPDLYVWPPDWSHGEPPIVSNIAGNAIDRLYITDTVEGDYMIEVYGFTPARYNINIEVGPAGNPLQRSERPDSPAGAMVANPVMRFAPALRADNTPRTDIMPVSPAPYRMRVLTGTLSGVLISGTQAGEVGVAYTFSAASLADGTLALPGSVQLPITYTWQATDYSSLPPHSGESITDTMAFTWDITGTKHITVMASNAANEATGYHTVTISQAPQNKVYLPLVLKQ